MDQEFVHSRVSIACISSACAAFVVAIVFNAFASTGIAGELIECLMFE